MVLRVSRTSDSGAGRAPRRVAKRMMLTSLVDDRRPALDNGVSRITTSNEYIGTVGEKLRKKCVVGG